MAYKNQNDANAYQRKWRAEHPERSREISRRHYWKNPVKHRERCLSWARKRNYGITEEEYRNRLNEQSGCCKICSIEMNPPNVDHNHDTGEVRGLICTNCNLLLGNAKEDFAILLKAAFYLTRQL